MARSDEEVGRAVARARGDRSQKELGERMAERGWKWSQSTVWSVESGKRPLRYGEAVDLCGILGIHLERLKGDDQEWHASRFKNEYFVTHETLRSALHALMRTQLELASETEAAQEFPQDLAKQMVDVVFSDNLFETFVRHFEEEAGAEVKNGTKDHGFLTTALLQSWQESLLSIDRYYASRFGAGVVIPDEPEAG